MSMHQFMKSRHGAALIEFAFIAPVLILILVASIDYGIYYLRSQTANRAVANLSHAIALNPNDPAIAGLRNQQGLGFINLRATGNHLCAQSYATQAAADRTGCTGQTFNTATPDPTMTDYFVVVDAQVSDGSVTGLLSQFLPPIRVRNVVRASAVIPQQLANINNTLTNQQNQITNTSNSLNNSLTQTSTNLSSRINSVNSSTTSGLNGLNSGLANTNSSLQQTQSSLASVVSTMSAMATQISALQSQIQSMSPQTNNGGGACFFLTNSLNVGTRGSQSLGGGATANCPNLYYVRSIS